MTRIIQNETDVPREYIALAEFGRHNKRVHTYLSHLHRRGKIEAVKLMRSPYHKTRQVWVDHKTPK